MRLLGEFIRHEARIQWRSHAFKVMLALYVAGCSTPVVAIYANRRNAEAVLGAATYAAAASMMQPFLTAAFAALLGATAAVRESAEGSFETLGVAPLTNSGYLLRRWMAVVSIVVPASLVSPVIGAMLARAAGAPFEGLGPFVWPWLFRAVPVALIFTAIGLAYSTVAGGPLRAVVIGFLFGGIPLSLGNDLLARIGRHVGTAGDWLDFASVGKLLVFLNPPSYLFYYVDMASDAPIDKRLLFDYLAPRAAVTAGTAVLLLAAAAYLTGRTRRDLRPWRIRADHPLRTMQASLNRLRAALAPEPAPAPVDRVLLLCGLLAVTLSVSYLVVRGERYRARGIERLEAETGGAPAPTDRSVVPGAWAIGGSLDGGGRLDARLSAEVRNTGSAAISHLAFSLNPDLAIGDVKVSAGSVRRDRIWDRLSLDLDPPLRPGETRRVEIGFQGRPGHDRFPINHRLPFAISFRRGLEARLAPEIPDLSGAYTLPAASPRRIDLAGGDLMPVLRYTPWKLTPAGKTDRESGMFVPEESLFPRAEIDVDLRVPAGMMVADSCGDVSIPDGGGARVTGRCSIAPARFAVRGGALTRLAASAGNVLVIPSHAALAERHLSALWDAGEMAARAWPGAGPTEETAVVEWPQAYDPEAGSRNSIWRPGSPLLEGSTDRLVLIEESIILRSRPLQPEGLAAEFVSLAMERRREVATSEAVVFRKLYRAVAEMKMNGPRSGGAVIQRGEASDHDLREPILSASAWRGSIWTVKLPALIAWIVARAGESSFTAALQAFLDDPSGRPGTVRELMEGIGRQAGISLDRVYMDYFEGDALPVLSLEDVVFRNRGGGWDVSGHVRNLGTGETTCQVVLRTEAGSVDTSVRVGPESVQPFSLRSSLRPRTLLLDPLHRCYRFSPKVKVIEAVQFRESP